MHVSITNNLNKMTINISQVLNTDELITRQQRIYIYILEIIKSIFIFYDLTKYIF